MFTELIVEYVKCIWISLRTWAVCLYHVFNYMKIIWSFFQNRFLSDFLIDYDICQWECWKRLYGRDHQITSLLRNFQFSCYCMPNRLLFAQLWLVINSKYVGSNLFLSYMKKMKLKKCIYNVINQKYQKYLWNL